MHSPNGYRLARHVRQTEADAGLGLTLRLAP